MKKYSKETMHGGCHGCYLRDKRWVDQCKRCQYLKGNFDLPDMNDSIKRMEENMLYNRQTIMNTIEFKIVLTELTSGVHKGFISKASKKDMDYSQPQEYMYDHRSINVDEALLLRDSVQYFHILLMDSEMNTQRPSEDFIRSFCKSVSKELLDERFVITLNCGCSVTKQDISYTNRCNEEGDGYYEGTATCKCGEYEWSEWGECVSLSEAIEDLKEQQT